MAEGKIHFQLGQLSFEGEGSEQWVSSQLAILLEKIPSLMQTPAIADMVDTSGDGEESKKAVQVGSLASHIKSKGGESNQTLRFLATADWLRLKGDTTLKTGTVSKALQENHQKKLANPADCLNKNVTKGFCEKAGVHFFITPEGLKQLGYNA